VRSALLAYPVLMAADILLYQVETVPVGDDQRQHLELARTLAVRFNTAYGETFTVPRAVSPPVAARVMDLQDPDVKMSKSAPLAAPGVIRLLDPPDVIRRKIARAVTDSGQEVVYDPDGKPGVANLLTILAACTESTPAAAAAQLDSYRQLKEATAEAVIALLDPLQRRYTAIRADDAALMALAREGARTAQELAQPTLMRARSAIGLLES
jgi:tryptophanyl-tRNA synthetase